MRLLFATLIVGVILQTGCTSARWAAMNALNKSHHIKQYSGGKLIGEWDSVGIVNSEGQSDGYYFEDAKSRNLVTLTGDVQITIND